MKNKYLFLLLLIGNLLNGDIKYVNTGGTTYKLVEKDITKVIKEYIDNNKVKIEAKLNKERKKMQKKINIYKPQDLKIVLSPARNNKTFYPDPSYVLDMDIKDINGKIIYPKGYKFNPLNYIKMN